MFLIYLSSQSSSYRTDIHYYAQLEVLAFSNYHLHFSVFISVFALVPSPAWASYKLGKHSTRVLVSAHFIFYFSL